MYLVEEHYFFAQKRQKGNRFARTKYTTPFCKGVHNYNKTHSFGHWVSRLWLCSNTVSEGKWLQSSSHSFDQKVVSLNFKTITPLGPAFNSKNAQIKASSITLFIWLKWSSFELWDAVVGLKCIYIYVFMRIYKSVLDRMHFSLCISVEETESTIILYLPFGCCCFFFCIYSLLIF